MDRLHNYIKNNMQRVAITLNEVTFAPVCEVIFNNETYMLKMTQEDIYSNGFTTPDDVIANMIKKILPADFLTQLRRKKLERILK